MLNTKTAVFGCSTEEILNKHDFRTLVFSYRVKFSLVDHLPLDQSDILGITTDFLFNELKLDDLIEGQRQIMSATGISHLRWLVLW